MFRFLTFGQAKNDKQVEAIQFAKEVADYINSKYKPVSVQVYSEVFEDLNNIYWYSDYKDLQRLRDFVRNCGQTKVTGPSYSKEWITSWRGASTRR